MNLGGINQSELIWAGINQLDLIWVGINQSEFIWGLISFVYQNKSKTNIIWTNELTNEFI